MKSVIEDVIERTEIPEDCAEEAVRATFAAIEDGLRRGEPVRVRGFGVFEAVTVRGRPGWNFAVGKRMPGPSQEKRTVKFRPGTRVLRAVEGRE